MTRRRLTTVLATAAILATATAGGAAHAGTTSKCRTSSTTGGAKIVSRTSEAVVFIKRGSYYGCTYSGSIRRLPGWDDMSRFTLSGRFVAYIGGGTAIGDEFARIIVFDMKLGRTQSISQSNSVGGLVLKRNGSVAWTQASIVDQPIGAPPSREVRMRQAADPDDILLDRGTDIDPSSLALDATRTNVSWTRGGQPRTSPID
jgi:hypothetical protein